MRGYFVRGLVLAIWAGLLASPVLGQTPSPAPAVPPESTFIPVVPVPQPELPGLVPAAPVIVTEFQPVPAPQPPVAPKVPVVPQPPAAATPPVPPASAPADSRPGIDRPFLQLTAPRSDPAPPKTPAQEETANPPARTEPAKTEPTQTEAKKEDKPPYWIVGDDLRMTARWNHGLMLETADKAFRIHPVGRLQADLALMAAGQNVQFGRGGVGRVDDGMAFRRLRIGVEGTLWEVFDFWLEPDYLNTFNAEGSNEERIIANTVATTDLWGQVSHLPWIGNVRIGSIKPAYSLEHMTSSRFLDFMERSPMFDAFVGGIDNGFQPGIMVHNWALEERVTWQFTASHNQLNIFGFNTGGGEYNYAGRVTALPYYRDKGRELLHLGFSYNHRQLDDRQTRFRARPSVRNGPAALATALVDLRLAGVSQDMVMPEVAAVVGPLTLSAEYAGTWVHNTAFPATGANRTPRGTLFFQGFYVNALYFLTGESRPYNTRTGAWDRVIPFENFFLVRDADGCMARGWGAWQLGARYSFLDLNDAGVGGGTLHDLTLGLNWFWNPNMKWQFNYSLARRDVPGALGNGIIQGFGTRFAMDF